MTVSTVSLPAYSVLSTVLGASLSANGALVLLATGDPPQRGLTEDFAGAPIMLRRSRGLCGCAGRACQGNFVQRNITAAGRSPWRIERRGGSCTAPRGDTAAA